MFLQLRAVKREGFNGVWAAGRLWPSSEALRVEILDTDEDGPMIPQDLVENGKVVGQRDIHDMEKIGKKSLAEIKADGRISIFPDGDADLVISAEEFKAAKESVADLTVKYGAALARIAELEEAAKSSAGKSKK